VRYFFVHFNDYLFHIELPNLQLMEYLVQTVLHIHCSNEEVASAGIVIVIVCRIQGAGKVNTLVVDIIGHCDLSVYCKVLQTTLYVSFIKTCFISTLL
jgi:hypothetical protein